MRYLLAAFFIIYASPIYGQSKYFNHGTSIIAFITNDTVWVAGDTKVQDDTETNSIHRKIFKTGNIVYSFSEIPRPSINKKEIYNAFDIMDYFIKKQITLDAVFDKFNDSITKRLTVFIDSLKIHGYYDVVEMYKKQPVLEMFMISFANENPKFKYRTYTFNEQENNIIPFDPSVSNGFGKFLWLGSKIHAMDYLRIHKNYFDGFKNCICRLN